MDLSRLPLWMLAAAATMLLGCSSDSKELRSSAQAEKFLVDIARGGDISSWHLAGGATSDAARVWEERGAIQDLGRRLRRDGKAWACQLAEGSGQVGSIGTFNENDRRGVTINAMGKGATRYEINALIDNDVLKMSNPDLVEATTTVCANIPFG